MKDKRIKGLSKVLFQLSFTVKDYTFTLFSVGQHMTKKELNELWSENGTKRKTTNTRKKS